MTLNEYLLLRPEDRADITWKYGAFIAMAEKGFLKVLLYQINSFYVEVYYNCDLGRIEEFRCFDSTDGLEPYLAAIDLSELLPVEQLAYAEPARGLRKRIWKRLHKLFL